MELEELFTSGRIAVQRGAIFDKLPAAPPAAHLRDRIRGMMLGLAIGDALGNTSESCVPPQRRRLHGEITNYLPNWWANDQAVGLPSDDTQLAFWTLEHLLERGRLEPTALATKFAERVIFGRGRTVGQFVANRRAGKPWYLCGPHSAGNGALMRIAPMLIPFVREPSPALWAETARSALITHNDPASIAACVSFVSILWDLLSMETAPRPEWWLERYVSVARELEGETRYRPRGGHFMDYEGPVWRFVANRLPVAHRAGLATIAACESWHSGAFLLETVPCVWFILMRHGHDARSAIVRAVNDTRDNDTTAAIVGAAVGALHGEAALPQEWRDGLLGRLGADDDGAVFELLQKAEAAFL